ncbi:MAG: alpha/beta hydrolase [Isosphaeraceae bacterium]
MRGIHDSSDPLSGRRATVVMLLLMTAVPGCIAIYVPRPRAASEPLARGPGPDLSDTIHVDSPRDQIDPDLRSNGSNVETWVVHTRASEQLAGESPWASLSVSRLDERGGPPLGAEPEALVARMANRPVVVLVHGNGYLHREAVREAIDVRAALESLGGLTPESLFIVFDWPSERLNSGLVIDLNEKSRRSRIASYHLARFLQAAPPGARICLMGHSDGGRIVLTTAHLLSGAELLGFLREPAVQLENGRRDLRLRLVTLDAAAEHDWLNPGRRLEHALPTCEALLNLPNRKDYALSVYALGRYTGIRGASGGRV